MPTPRPTIVATVGAVTLMSVTAAMSVITDMPTPSPKSATTSGSPAATTEPSASTMMISAATMPIASATPLGAWMFSTTWPPSSTCRPASFAGRAAARSSSIVSTPFRSVTGFRYRTEMSAVSPSADGRASPTSPTSGNRSTRLRTSASTPGSMRLPLRSCTTTLAPAPLSSGNRSASRSAPACDGAPETV